MNLSEEQVYSGHINHWDDERGYGFIAVKGHHGGIFFHIKSFAYMNIRPQLNQEVVFYVQKKEHKWQATRVLLEKDKNGINQSGAYDENDPLLFETVLYIFLVIIYYGILNQISVPIASTGLILSGLTFYLFWQDKHKARHKKFRIPEATLWVSALIGGWPGGLIARQLLRHKLNSSHFIVFFWACMVIHFSIIYTLTKYLGINKL